MGVNFTFGEAHFNRIFPFYMLINQQMVVESTGDSLEKIFGGTAGTSFSENYKINRPKLSDLSFWLLKSRQNELFVIECLNPQQTTLRGQLEFLPETNQLLFLGSPWFGSIEEVLKNKLSLNDFARHDSMTDLLHVLKAQENTNEDLKELLKRVNHQKDELKTANKAIHDIALFPTQNPDPLIRINFNGDLLQNNPAAALLDFIEFEKRVYRNDDFFKLIATRIDTNQKRWEFEAGSENKEFSFVCVTMKEEGYINIYGRDITQQKKDRQELELLSLIIQQTVNAVIVTDAFGKVEWVNNAFYKVTGYTLEEIKGKTPGSVLQGKETDPASVLYMKERISNAAPFTCEIYNYKKSGEGYWLRINGQPIFDAAGKVVKFFAIEEDITREKEDAAKLEEFDKRIKIALQKIGDNVWEYDIATSETTFVQEEYNILGYSSEEFNNIAHLWYNCIFSEDKKMVDDIDIKYRAGQIDHHKLEYRMIHKDGSVKWVLDRGAVIERTNVGKPLKIIGTNSDITNQKELEKELEATATRMFSLISNLNQGILLKDVNNSITLINQRFCDLFDLDQNMSTMIGTDYAQFAADAKNLFKYPEQFVSNVNEILKERKAVSGEKLELKDGRTFERDFVPVWNKERYEGHLWVYTDITEKINADRRLNDQRIFYEEILDKIPADIAVFDIMHHYLYVNYKAVKDQEVRKWMIGKSDEEYVRFRNKPLSIAEERNRIFDEILAFRQLKSWEESITHPDGTSEYILRHMYPVLNEKEQIKMVIGYGVDITPVKTIQQQIEQSEKRYRDVIDNSLAIVTTHDLNGRFITVNPMAGKIYGYADHEMVGHSLMEFMPERDSAFFNEQYLQKIIQEKQASGIFRVVEKGGNIIYSLYNNFLKEEPGKEPYVIGFAVDITDRIKAEKELKLAKKITEELAQSKQNFLANMSHEIRTPMNAIMGMAGQLGKTRLNKDQHFYLDTINSASENLLIILNDILDLSKIEAGKLTLEQIGFDPASILSRAMQVMKHKAEEKGLAFTNSFNDSRLSPVLLGDPYRLNQVLLNLISNAIKFTEKGSVDISCEIINDTPDQQIICVVVKDTGIGMVESFAKNLFQKFSQEDESVTRRYGGTGLGMSICKDLVELMGGTIRVESKKGAGTSVIFEIAFEKGTDADLPHKNIDRADTNILQGKKILVADDNKMNRMVAKAMLKGYGAEIIQATNGIEAINMVKKMSIDLVLMDIQMPIMDGLKATKKIRNEISKDLPIIALTAFAIKGDNLKCEEAGMNDYLSKPFQEAQLLNMVCKWLDMQDVSFEEKKTDNVTDVALFSLSKIEDLAQGDPTFVEEMIAVFIEQATLSIQQMKIAFEKGDIARIKSVAHRIKPTIDNMCIDSLMQEIRDIETNAESLLARHQLESMIEMIERTFKKIIIQLKK
jgi:PAS domain S-box-containing protein